MYDPPHLLKSVRNHLKNHVPEMAAQLTPATLRTICVRKTSSFLMNGTWDEWEINPFSTCQIPVVEDILSSLWLEGSRVNRVSIAHSRLLLTSGRLAHFELPCTEDNETSVNILRMLSRGCQNLRRLTLLRVNKDMDAVRALQQLLQNCGKLEYLHSRLYFEPDSIRKCVNLKILRLHFSTEEAIMFTRCITSDHLKHIGSIRKFSVCQIIGIRKESDGLRRETVSILDKCPHLTSLGSIDSSATLKELHDRDARILRTPRQFQLRSCYWKARPYISQTEYCDMVRVAVLSCPLLEVLMIRVRYGGCLQHLKTLRNLTSLEINLDECDDDYEDELYSLLDEIGPQLRHLCIDDRESQPLSLSVITGSCPNLRTLQLLCQVTADEGAQSGVNWLYLENFSAFNINRESLIFLLSSCQRLKMLCLDHCGQFEDGALYEILRKNPFAELKMASIKYSSLSKSGWTRFVQSAEKLSKCCFQSYVLRDYEAQQCVRDVNPTIVCLSPKDFYKHKMQEFHIDKLFSCY